MLDVPAYLFYAAVVALVVVCSLFAVLLYFLIKVARTVLTVTRYVDSGVRNIGGIAGSVRRMIGLGLTLFK